MEASAPYIHRASPPIAGGLGLLALSGGIYSLFNPVAFADGLGIPLSSPSPSSSPAVPYVKFTGARNIGSGISLLALLYGGHRKAAGVALMAGSVTALADAWVCVEGQAKEGKAVGHAVMGVLAVAVGAGLYWF